MTPERQNALAPWRSPAPEWSLVERLLPDMEHSVAMGGRARPGAYLDGCALPVSMTMWGNHYIEIVLRMSPALIPGASDDAPWSAGPEQLTQAYMRMLRLVLAAPMLDAPAMEPPTPGPRETLAALMLDETFGNDGSIRRREADQRLATPLGTGGVSVFETHSRGLRVDRSPALVLPGAMTVHSKWEAEAEQDLIQHVIIDAPHARIDLPVLDALGRMRLEAEAAAKRTDDQAGGTRS